MMNTIFKLSAILIFSSLISACSDSSSEHDMNSHDAHGEEEVEIVKGPNGGRMLVDGEFTLELAIFETGVPPEFRAWATQDGTTLAPTDVDLNIKLTRLGGKVDDINFRPQGDALRGDTVIYEPHSFVVTINAKHDGKNHQWQYDNFEGRTKIEPAVAEALEVETERASAKTLHETINVFGLVVPNAEGISKLSARFPGVIKSIALSVGDSVKKGQTLATVESNESLNHYQIKAPISGVITERNANMGEQTSSNSLFTIVDTSQVWIELSIFPSDRNNVRIGAPVKIIDSASKVTATGKISSINVTTEANQSVKARVVIDNKKGLFLPGSFVSAQVEIAEHSVPLAVKRTGLQAFRDFTVVYAKVGDQYEVRMLELGRQDNEWVEVLGGLEIGTQYVSENSYVIKADIEKSGAAHDH